MTRVLVKATPEDRVQDAAKRRGLRSGMEPGEIEAWIDANVTDLASAKAVLEILAIEVAAIKNAVRRRERTRS